MRRRRLRTPALPAAGPTVGGLPVLWDHFNAGRHGRKHRVSFEEAWSCLLDPHALEEVVRVKGEERVQSVALNAQARLLFVVYAQKGTHYDFIEARQPTSEEIDAYHSRR